MPLSAQRADTLLLRTHTRILAADSLGGRDTGSRGAHAAAAYITAELQRLGLTPAGDSGFAAAVPVERVTIDTLNTRLGIAGNTARFRYGTDFIFAPGAAESFRDFSGKLLYTGRVHRPGPGRTALSGRVLVINEWPDAEADAVLMEYAAAGVAGIIVIGADSAAFESVSAELGNVRYTLHDIASDALWRPPLPIILAGSRLTAALVPSMMKQRGGVDVRVTTVTAREAVDASNVIALLPGTDSARHDVAALAAHFDHLGMVRGANIVDSIYNGFSDNAAGVAMLLTLAESLAQSPPPYTMLFLFFTGEERGLLGSSWFAARPTFPLERIRVLVNLDAGAPPAPPVSWRIATNDPALATEAAHALENRGWAVERSAARANSDHWPLERARVPSVFLVPGADWEDLGSTEEAALRARWDRYHQLDDEWSADFPFGGLERYAEAALILVRSIMAR